MAGISLHPKPAPVRLSRKVIDAIAVEACLDVDWEAMHEDRPEELIATYQRIGRDIAYIEMLLSGELGETWAVLRAQKELDKEYDRIAEEIGAELLRGDRLDEKGETKRRREAERTIKRLRKQARRVKRAIGKTNRYWDEVMEHEKDQEAAERLGLAGGGEG